MMAIMDGADAAKWALILVGIGTETYIDWYKAKARSRPNALQQVHDYWFACAWRIALAMLGMSCKEVTTDIMQDVTAYNEQDDTPLERPWKGSKGKNKNKGKGKGKQALEETPWDQSNDQWWKRQTWQSQWYTPNN